MPARQASGAVVAVFSLRLLAAGLGMAVLALLTRHLGPSRFGELSLIFTVAVVASRVSELGTTHVTAGEMAARPDRRRELAAGLAAVRFGAGLATAVAAAGLLVVLLDRPAAEWAGVAVMATVPLAGITGLVVLASARLRPQVDATLALGQSALWLGCVAVAVSRDVPFVVYGVAFLGCGLIQALTAWAVVVRAERPAWTRWRPGARRVLTRSWPMAVAMVLSTVYARMDGVLLFELRGPAPAGVYSAAYRFLDVFQLLPLAMLAVLVPVLARRWALGDRSGMGEAFRLGATVAAVLGSALACGAVVAGHRVAAGVFGTGFLGAGDILAVLCLSGPAIATGYVASAALVAVGQVRAVGAVAAAAVGASLVADLLLIPRWGAAGAAWASVAVEYLTGAALVVLVERRVGLRFPWSRAGRAFVAAGVAALAGWPLRGLPAVALVVAVAALFAASAGALRAATADDVRALTSPRLGLGAADETVPPRS